MCIATTFIAACSHLELRPRPPNIIYALVRGVRTLGHKRQRTMGAPALLPSVPADPESPQQIRLAFTNYR